MVIISVQGYPQRHKFIMLEFVQGPLLDLAPRLAGYLQPGGTLALSGILVSQVPAVKAAYGALGLTGFYISEENGWALVTAQRPC